MSFRRNGKNKYWQRAAVCVIVAFSVFWIAMDEVDFEPVYKPEYKKINLETVVDFTEKSWKPNEEDYEVLFRQTGLGASGVDYILKHKKNPMKELKEAQEVFFKGYPYVCSKSSIFSKSERVRDGNGKKINCYELIDVKPGDVLVSMSTHTMGYRHGHCGVVVEGAKGKKQGRTIEAVYWGKPTKYQKVSKWKACPTLVHLRISKEAAESKGYTQAELGRQIAALAKEECIDVQYALIPGLFNYNSNSLKRTHCSHVIWYVFNEFGFDIDSDGGPIVTPWDIAGSDFFEVIQIYGIDPDML